MDDGVTILPRLPLTAGAAAARLGSQGSWESYREQNSLDKPTTVCRQSCLGCLGRMESRLPRPGRLEGHRFFSLGPRVSCCYWVRCGPTMPCTARVILPSIKHQAQDPGPEPQPPTPKSKSRRPQAPEAERPWNWAVSSGDGSHVVFVSPHRIDTVLTNSTSASTPLHRDGARRRGGPASVSFNPRRPPPNIQPNAISQSDPPESCPYLVLMVWSCVLCPRSNGPSEKETSSCPQRQQLPLATDINLTHLVSPYRPPRSARTVCVCV